MHSTVLTWSFCTVILESNGHALLVALFGKTIFNKLYVIPRLTSDPANELFG